MASNALSPCPIATPLHNAVQCRRRQRLTTRCVASPDAPTTNGASTAGKEYGRKFNFSAGPACLPVPVLEKAQSELLNWKGTSGMSVMEMSHRGKEFKSIVEKAEADLRTLLAVPDNYKVLFLQGGATTQFAAVPLNLSAGPDSVVDYVVTGAWGKKAVKEAKKFCKVNIAATSESDNFTSIPDFKDWNLSEDASYVHICSNETIGGVEFKVDPPEEIANKTVVVADMSSNFCSKPIDVSRYGVIYAGAQKNIGPAGVTVVIVREDLAEAGKARSTCPSMLDYSVMSADPPSLFNTPSGYSIYMCGLVFEYLLENGGLEAAAARNEKKAAKLYEAISASNGFYQCPVDESVRSLMNVPYRIFPNELESVFLKEAEANELLQLKGHRSVGGLRASIYNSMPEEGIDALVNLMKEFQSKHT